MKTEFEQGLQNDLRHGEQAIDTQQMARLSALRQQALHVQPASTTAMPRRLRRLLWPSAGMALASILVLVLTLPFSPFSATSSNEYLSDNFELYEDLEFYYWLAANEVDVRG
ncbi:MAG: hypothetical protein KBT88_03635 [Gammaproteobacteria bacterium]|nr:hypothetical protein [Gammaproteobacteria bacterium]MBQ0838853.1 hypothetical protein [Gammaproteobacteria bacterium]